jgi:hypothetical protein
MALLPPLVFSKNHVKKECDTIIIFTSFNFLFYFEIIKLPGFLLINKNIRFMFDLTFSIDGRLVGEKALKYF